MKEKIWKYLIDISLIILDYLIKKHNKCTGETCYFDKQRVKVNEASKQQLQKEFNEQKS